MTGDATDGASCGKMRQVFTYFIYFFNLRKQTRKTSLYVN